MWLLHTHTHICGPESVLATHNKQLLLNNASFQFTSFLTGIAIYHLDWRNAAQTANTAQAATPCVLRATFTTPAWGRIRPLEGMSLHVGEK